MHQNIPLVQGRRVERVKSDFLPRIACHWTREVATSASPVNLGTSLLLDK